MISGLYFLSQKGDSILSRVYRDDVGRNVSEAFKVHVLMARNDASSLPIKMVGTTSFVYVRHLNVVIVAATKANANALMVLEFLRQMLAVFKSYFGKFDEDALRHNFVLVYELLDEMLDHGYPQTLTPEVLKMFITQSGSKVDQVRFPLTHTHSHTHNALALPFR